MKEMIENRKDRGIIKSDFKIKGDQKLGFLCPYRTSEHKASRRIKSIF